MNTGSLLPMRLLLFPVAWLLIAAGANFVARQQWPRCAALRVPDARLRRRCTGALADDILTSGEYIISADDTQSERCGEHRALHE